MPGKDALNRFFSSDQGTRTLSSLYGVGSTDGQRSRWLDLAARYHSVMGGIEARAFSSPGRTELGGNHTDHNHGRVLCAAVHMDIIALVSPRDDAKVILESDGWPEPFVVDLSDLEPRTDELGKTAALIRGTAAALKKRGAAAGGFHAMARSSVPAGSGLSSSAAFELLIAQIQNALYNEGRLPAETLAMIGKEAENLHFGKPCGLMDQMACALGAVSSIDFSDPARPSWRRVDFDLEGAGYVLAVVNAGDSHEDLTDEYTAIPTEMRAVAACLGRKVLRGASERDILSNAAAIRKEAGDRALLRALHFIAEDERAAAMAAALERGDIRSYLELARESGDSSWRLLQNVIPAGAARSQAVACAIALSAGFLGKDGAVRVHGGGFAGTIQAYVPRERAAAYAEYMDTVLGRGAATLLHIRPYGAMEVRT